MHGPMSDETAPLLLPIDQQHQGFGGRSANSNSASPCGGSPRERLPRWFLAMTITSAAVAVAWLAGLVAFQGPSSVSSFISPAPEDNRPRAPTSQSTSTDKGTWYLYAGVANSLLGSFLSASGYCCQKAAHNQSRHRPALGTATQKPLFVFGLFLLAVGTISAVVNLGILGQAVQAPFAALTLIYSALLGRFVLLEPLELLDVASSVLITIGVGVDVAASAMAHVEPQAFTLESLSAVVFRESAFPMLYTVLALGYTLTLLRHVHHRGLHRHAAGLLAFSSSAGIMAGFTSLVTKAAVEVAKSALRQYRDHPRRALYEIFNPLFPALLAGIPCALIPQLFFLNKGLECFGTLQFIPLYQAFIILGNMLCGMVFLDEMAAYSAAELLCFLAGIVITLAGVCLLLAKVHAGPHPPRVPTAPFDRAVVEAPFETHVALGDVEWAERDVRTLADFDECTSAMVDLLHRATTSVHYSTFLCDFTLQLRAAPPGVTILSCLEEAVARGVEVHILYNPIADYGTAPAADLEQLLPPGVRLTCAVSDLGPNPLTALLSNNTKYAFHHQKYLCVDGRVLMVTGCDVNAEREGWLRVNALGYYWHELSVVAPCSVKMFQWIRDNHSEAGKRRHYDAFHRSPPFPLVAGGWREENVMVEMILHARFSVHLENQILISGGTIQHNRICAAIACRIARAFHHGERFHVLVLTNAAQKDEPSQVTRLYCAISVQWSLEQLENAAMEYGLPRGVLGEYLLVGQLQHGETLIKVHSNVLIVDGWQALRSSSNLADRSLSARPTDTELGLLFRGDAVASLQQTLFHRYLSLAPGEWRSVGDVIDAARRGAPGCCIKPLPRKPWSPVWTWFFMHLFVYASEGATGGRVKVTFRFTSRTVPPKETSRDERGGREHGRESKRAVVVDVGASTARPG